MIVWRVRWTGPVQPSIRSAPSTGTFGMSFSVTTFMTALPRLTGSKLSEIRSPSVPGNRLPRAPSGCKLNGVQLAAKGSPRTIPTRRKLMSGHAHLTPAQIRAKLNHPVVDGDGHWVEYDPVFSEQMRKVGGDLA